jgi:SAM-dependent methyltransferase
MRPQGEWPAEGLEWVPACPICGDERRALFFEDLTDRLWFSAPGRWSLYRCHSCSSAFLDPRPTRSTISRAYSSYYTHAAQPAPPRPEYSGDFRTALLNGYLNARYGYDLSPASRLGPLVARIFPKRRWYSDRLVRNLSSPAGEGRLLDIGCGTGEFLAQMRRAGWLVKGLEPDVQAAARARSAGVPVVNAALEDSEFAPDSFDAITMSHVIEHLHDPLGALRICRRILQPDGLLWIATPNLDAMGRKAFGRDWIGLDPPRHLVLFTRASLANALGTAGFERQQFLVDYSAERVFPCSAAVAAGEDPRDSRVVWRHRSSLHILAADMAARIAPRRAEELVVLATAK